MTVTARVAGAACWAELDAGDSADLDAVTAFYGAVLGWTPDASPSAEHQQLAVHAGGVPVAALGSPGAATPPAWTLYLAVDNVDAAAEALEELGGQVLHGPEDDLAGGRLLVALDAGGAAVGLWESDDALPAPGPGRLCWAEAASAEPGTTRTFYRALFGWEIDDDDEDGAGRLVCRGEDGRALAGLGLAGDALPHWLPVFAVADADAALAAARDAGGTVVTPVSEGPRGRQATLTDPAGARFGVIRIPG
ncbi:VOC family protein [Actinomycetospora sp. NBRC 106375]|uniref:VOC family protein n=1 Tax=Actinomycetospora sp. NBRC 106375 TaxID=3032207 RepID=UPI002556B8B1|nr:VOC family protein [Actinomycetospora sp. NBRC 106375]